MRRQLREHRKEVHENEGNVRQCGVCGEILKTEKSLKKHELVHLDVKPFECNICGMHG